MTSLSKRISLFLATVILLLCPSFLLSCAKIYDSIEYNYFNTLIRIQVEDKKLTTDVKNELSTLFSQLEKDFDREYENSFIHKYNGANTGDIIALNDHQVSVLTYSKQVNEYSLGLFNPAIYPLLEVWQFAPNYPVKDFAKPSNEQVLDALKKVPNFSNIQFDSQTKTIVKHGQSQLDLGGIVKGYAVDLAGAILKDHGYEKGYVSLGASSLYILWSTTLSIRNPIATNQNLLEVNLSSLKDISLSTSGDYEKYYIDKESGEKYSHVIDTNTGYPTTTGVNSVTVIGGDGAFSDAITTACLLLEHDAITPNDSPLAEFLKKILTDKKAKMVFAVYSKDGVNQIITNAKKGDDFTLLDNQFQVVNI